MSLMENNIENINFHPVGLSGKLGVIKFSVPNNLHEGSFQLANPNQPIVEFECKDLTALMLERGHKKINLLKNRP